MARKSNINTSLSDVKIHSVSIVPKSGGAVSIESLWNVINLHESIFRPVITGNIHINDTVNLRSSYKFQGDERIFISFSKPTNSSLKESRYSKIFRIVKVENFKQNDKGSGASYVLRFCSEELFTSLNSKKISRVFENGTYSDYVAAICLNDLNMDSNSFKALENSYGQPRTHNISNLAPFEAIEFFERHAVNEIKSPFLFFENFFGYNFISLSKMYDGLSVVPGGLTVATAKNSEDAASYVPVKFNEILNFNISKINDAIQLQKSLAGKLDSIDILRADFSTFNYIAADMDPGNFTNKESVPPTSNAEDPNKSYSLSARDRSVMPWRLSPSTTSRLTALTNISPFQLETTVRESDSSEENFLMQRQGMLNLLEYTSINSCEVAGNPAFTVGIPLDIKMPAFTQNREFNRNIDPYLSGRYLITKVRHNLTKSTGLRTFLSLASNAPAIPIAG